MNMMHLCLITFFIALEQSKKINYGKYNFINNYKTTFGPYLAGIYWVEFKFGLNFQSVWNPDTHFGINIKYILIL